MKKTLTHMLSSLKTALNNRPAHALLILTTAFFFTLFMLVNILYIRDPFGGWVTSFGVFSSASIKVALLFPLSLSLFALWRAVDKHATSTKPTKATVKLIKRTQTASAIDYPKRSTQAVVSGYAVA